MSPQDFRRVDRNSRRRFLAQSGVGLLGLVAGQNVLAEVAPERMADGSLAKDMITPAAQRCIERGLDFLARNQQDGGSFGERQYRGNVAITSLAGLALMAGGHQPGRGQYGKVVTDALQFVLSKEDRRKAGFFHNPSAATHGPMYEHGFGALFLAEVHGMVGNKELREEVRTKLKRAVTLIVDSQNGEGGWRYQPEARDADISVTICQIMALRAARNAGVYVPKSVVDKCTNYVKACQDHTGGFRYMKQGGPPAFARTAAGVVALYSAGVYQGPEVERGLRYLMQFKPNQAFPRHAVHDLHYFYGHYYAAQAMWTAGGTYWSDWYPAIRDELIARAGARTDGAWPDSICSHYGTAMACIILQIPNNYLPILQR
jgi:hypothetical protein